MNKNINTQSNVREDVLRLECAPIDIVRIGFIGLGIRAKRAINRLIHIEGVEIKALCDISTDQIQSAQEILANNKLEPAKEFQGYDTWQDLCHEDIDLVYVCTDWLSHADIAVYAMNNDKHVAVEVPVATTVEKCWELVDTAEQTRKHCMMLENSCYDPFELTTLNMVQQGVFGEIIHAEGAYIHDLRSRNFVDKGDGSPNLWQTNYIATHTGNPYPTHGLGPIAQVMNIHRGDRMSYMVSMSSIQHGMTEYAMEQFGQDSPEAKQSYMLGDMNVSMIKTEMGKTIMLQHNINSPRPYSRIHLANGSKGYYQKYPIPQISTYPNPEESKSPEEIESLLEEYKHPFLKELEEVGSAICGEDRLRDYIMDYRLIHCLQNGLALDQDVYDAVEWSCIVELSEKSVNSRSAAVDIPDFTRGRWNKLDKLIFS